MIFDDLTRTRLLGSVEANRLVLLCEAGLRDAYFGNLGARRSRRAAERS